MEPTYPPTIHVVIKFDLDDVQEDEDTVLLNYTAKLADDQSISFTVGTTKKIVADGLGLLEPVILNLVSAELIQAALDGLKKE